MKRDSESSLSRESGRVDMMSKGRTSGRMRTEENTIGTILYYVDLTTSAHSSISLVVYSNMYFIGITFKTKPL